MFSLNALLDFSRCNCVGICATLVPINILATALTVVQVSRNPSPRLIHLNIGLASLAAALLALHDLSWLMIGVIMAPTYILFTIALVCLSFNAWAGFHPHSMRQLVLTLMRYCQKGLTLVWPQSTPDPLLKLDPIPLNRAVNIRRYQSQPGIRTRR